MVRMGRVVARGNMVALGAVLVVCVLETTRAVFDAHVHIPFCACS